MLFQLWSSEIKNFSIEDVEKNLWSRQAGLDDKSLARSVNEFNLAFTKYGINSCMQKIVFLALGYAETRFKSLGEEISSFNSSKSIYKGRGFHQLTGTRDGNGFYNSPGPYENYAKAVGNLNIISHPDLICKNIHYAIDSAGWFWTDPNMGKKVPLWSSSSNVKYIKFRANYFSKALGKPLNEVSHLVEDDEKYFWLQAKLLNGYPKGEKLEIEPNGWKTRKNAFDILKNNVFEFNIRCKGNDGLKFNGKWHDPVDNPMCTIFTQNQIGGEFNDSGKHWGLFGKTRGTSTHYGLDLFSIPGSPIYACVRCEVYNIITGDNVPKGYGKQIFLKVLDKETFLSHYREYSKLYPTKEYETIGNFSIDNDIILQYAHLRKIYVKKGWIISNINIPIGETGVSGVIQKQEKDGTCAPHLHFEIRNTDKSRINPGFFIDFKYFSIMSEDEKKLQQNTAKNGKIKEFNGLKDIYKQENDYK